MGTGKFNAVGNPAMDQYPIRGAGGIEVLQVASFYRNRDKLWPDGLLGLYVDFISISVSYKKNMQTGEMAWVVEKLLLHMTKKKRTGSPY